MSGGVQLGSGRLAFFSAQSCDRSSGGVRASPSVCVCALVDLVFGSADSFVHPSITLPRAGRARCIAMNGKAPSPMERKCSQVHCEKPTVFRQSAAFPGHSSFPTGEEDPGVDTHFGVP